ncbi:MAG TPA: response regulator transcription factor [Steroidobacteraceae bacterium]|nr:response regulator transcription factor [Steroidobacteraceae bacterium]
MSLKILVIDDHPLVQEGVATALRSLADSVSMLAARDAEEGLRVAAQHPDLDLVLLDLALPGMSGLNLIAKLHARLPSLPVVVLSALEEPDNVRHAINAGAMGFVPKSAATRVLLDVLRQVLEGNVTVPDALKTSTHAVAQGMSGAGPSSAGNCEPGVTSLTLRQLEVLARVCQGKTNKQIAMELGLSEKTVKAHVTAIFKVLGVVNRTQAVLVARRVGMLAD